MARGQEVVGSPTRRRTRAALLAAAEALVRDGLVPTVAEAAHAADISRATAYRYFPTRTALLEALVWDVTIPVPDWSAEDASADPVERIDALIQAALGHMDEVEPQLRASLRLSLEGGDQTSDDPPIRRGRRVELLEAALEPARARMTKKSFDRLLAALTALFGIEGRIAMVDVGHLSRRQADATVRWAARALVTAALSD